MDQRSFELCCFGLVLLIVILCFVADKDQDSLEKKVVITIAKAGMKEMILSLDRFT